MLHHIQAMRQQQTVCIVVLTMSESSTHFSLINLVAELTEQIHAELVRFANESDTVKSQVQTERTGLRDLLYASHGSGALAARPALEPGGSSETCHMTGRVAHCRGKSPHGGDPGRTGTVNR